MKQESLRRVALIAISSLIVGNLLTGCGASQIPIRPSIEPAPLILISHDCPAPDKPALSLIEGSLPFDHPQNIKAFLERDDIIRAYSKGLESTIDCYKSQSNIKED